MRSNSGRDESRNNMRDPTIRDGTEKGPEPRAHLARRTPRRQPTTACDARTNLLADAVVIRDPVECDGQHELACARGPTKCTFGLAHPVPRADHAPKNIGKARAGACDGGLETATSVDLRSAEVGLERRSAASLRNRRRIPRHRYAGRELRPFPVGAQPLAGVVLTSGHKASREQPSKRRFRAVDRH
jgi:hypothetical protein